MKNIRLENKENRPLFLSSGLHSARKISAKSLRATSIFSVGKPSAITVPNGLLSVSVSICGTVFQLV
jgi:hypothetical protein